VKNNFLHSLFGQCSVSLNGTTITQVGELYNYRSSLETILTYGTDAAASHLTNAFLYLDDGDMLPCDPTAADAKKQGIHRQIEQDKTVQRDPNLWAVTLQHLQRPAISTPRRPAIDQTYKCQAGFFPDEFKDGFKDLF
jgi:hypothetical protein